MKEAFAILLLGLVFFCIGICGLIVAIVISAHMPEGNVSDDYVGWPSTAAGFLGLVLIWVGGIWRET